MFYYHVLETDQKLIRSALYRDQWSRLDFCLSAIDIKTKHCTYAFNTSNDTKTNHNSNHQNYLTDTLMKRSFCSNARNIWCMYVKCI